MAGANIEDGSLCRRTLSVHHAICELPTPCPLHDAPLRTATRELVLPLRYTLVRTMTHKPKCPFNYCEGEAVTEVVCICALPTAGEVDDLRERAERAEADAESAKLHVRQIEVGCHAERDEWQQRAEAVEAERNQLLVVVDREKRSAKWNALAFKEENKRRVAVEADIMRLREALRLCLEAM